MDAEANESSAVLKASEAQLVRRNREKTGKRDRQRMPVKDCDTEQHRCEQDEVEWNSE